MTEHEREIPYEPGANRPAERGPSAFDAPDDGIDALVDALLVDALATRRGARAPDGIVRRRTQALCVGARAAGLPVERLLVTLKEAWRTAPEVRQLRRAEAASILERVVTLCIDEYYADVRRH